MDSLIDGWDFKKKEQLLILSAMVPTTICVCDSRLGSPGEPVHVIIIVMFGFRRRRRVCHSIHYQEGLWLLNRIVFCVGEGLFGKD